MLECSAKAKPEVHFNSYHVLNISIIENFLHRSPRKNEREAEEKRNSRFVNNNNNNNNNLILINILFTIYQIFTEQKWHNYK